MLPTEGAEWDSQQGLMYLQRGLFHHTGWRSVPLTERSVSYMKGWVLGHQQKKFLCLLNPHPSDTRFLCPLSFLSLCL